MTVGDPYTRPLTRSAAPVLIDVQRDFIDIPGDIPGEVSGDDAAMPLTVRARRSPQWPSWRAPSVSVGFRSCTRLCTTCGLYQPDGSNVDLVRRRLIEQGAPIAAPGSTGSPIAAELLPNVVELEHELLLSGGLQQIGTAEHVMYKPRWGAFYQTDLEQHLR